MRPARRLAGALLALLAAGCPRDQPAPPATGPSLPPDWLAPVLDRRLDELAGDRLPALDAPALREWSELLEAAHAGGQLGQRAERRLAARDPRERAAALLALVESRDASSDTRVLAYDRLARDAVPASLPRLVLRLKYEKDWLANASLAAALLRLGNGAGLSALRAILATEDADPLARAAAAAVLNSLPGIAPDADFETGWRHLLALEQEWTRTRLLPPGEGAPADRGLAAELWRTIAGLRSQPLRPVDDARFVLVRMRCGLTVPALLEASRDRDRYVRAHAFETLAWIGYPAGAWARRSGGELLEPLRTALLDASTRTHALAALGASGLPEAAASLLPWLQDGSFDERGAAADALLRCAGPEALPAVIAALDAPRPLGPEGRWSLELLRAESTGETAAAPPAELASGERLRRERWAAERALRP